MKKHTKISIITICYNSEKTIENTITSVLKQNYDNIEYIIIDGGSTDNTLDIVEKYANEKFIIVSEKDHGISDAFNKGIQKATGDIIGLINSDDMLCEDALNYIDKAYSTKPSDVIYGNTLVIDKSNNLVIKKRASSIKGIKYEMPFIHQSSFIKKSAYGKFGLYSLNYKICMDYDLVARIYKGGGTFQYIDKYISIFSYGGTSCKHPIRTINEDMKIAQSYGLCKLEALIYKGKRIPRAIIKLIAEKCGLWEHIYRLLKPYNVIDMECFLK